MRLVVRSGRDVRGRARVPGDKSISHRWLILAATASGRSVLRELPPSLDVRSTASCLAAFAPNARPGLDAWCSNAAHGAERNGFTWDADDDAPSTAPVDVEGEGRPSLRRPRQSVDCGNSGTTMRLLAGILAAAPFESVLVGDQSLMRRPMERLAQPLRRMGASVETRGGTAPLTIRGAALEGIEYRVPVPSAQLKSAVLLAGIDAAGRTEVIEPAPTRDHTERALEALGAPIERRNGVVALDRFQHAGFEASVPGDPSSAAFLIGAAAITGGEVEIAGVGLNPTRLRFLDVYRRMGVEFEVRERSVDLGEPAGEIVARGPSQLSGTTIDAEELPFVIDEVPVLAAAAANATGETWFLGAGELRVKESDRLTAIASSLRDLGAHAGDEGDDLVVAGGGVRGGRTSSGGDHRMAMAMAIAGAGARGPVEILDADAADVSFPGFAGALRAIGLDVDVEV